MNWTLLAGLTKAAIDQLPTMVELGVNVIQLLPELKKSVEAIAGSNTITAADAAGLRARIAEAEAAWAEQVAKARAELEAEAQKG